MDVEKFIKERSRMCEYYEEKCSNCPAKEIGCIVTLKNIRELHGIVEKWSEENTLKTRQTQLLEMYPKALICENGTFLKMCPKYLDGTTTCVDSCNECRKAFWSEEVE